MLISISLWRWHFTIFVSIKLADSFFFTDEMLFFKDYFAPYPDIDYIPY